MLILSVLAFFAVIFLLATITVAIAWMGFVKRTAEASDAARGHQTEQRGPDETELAEAEPAEASILFRDERLSSLNFWDSLLARFDFMAILKTRLEQAELDWTVGRVTLMMLLFGLIAGVILFKFVPGWGAF